MFKGFVNGYTQSCSMRQGKVDICLGPAQWAKVSKNVHLSKKIFFLITIQIDFYINLGAYEVFKEHFITISDEMLKKAF